MKSSSQSERAIARENLYNGTRSLPYRVSTNPRDRSGYGAALYFGNDLYQKTGDGRC